LTAVYIKLGTKIFRIHESMIHLMPNLYLMKKLILTALGCALFVSSNLFAQKRAYISSSGEMIFSFADISINGNDFESTLRWSPVFNFQTLVNKDFNDHLGLFYGLSVRNVGFIYSKDADTSMKHRTYNLGIPIGVKLGNVNGTFIWGGYEFEMPFHYKEKLFVNEEKEKKTDVWFSNRVNWYTQSVFVGINFPFGFNLKFKYYLDNFFNKDYTQGGVKIYQNTNVNVFYVALAWDVFEDVRKAYGGQKGSATPSRTSYTSRNGTSYFY
jgi:hypothetical protein